jgi:uncharacterized protein
LLYGLEGADNNFDVLQFVLPQKNSISISSQKIVNEEAVVLKGQGISGGKNISFTAIPYFLWQNRGIYQFATMLIQDEKKIIKETPTLNKKINTNG